MRRLLNAILILLVRLYRWILSPLKNILFGPLGRCRFEPTCSTYALEALQKHGPFRGSGLAVRRVCRCHPWGDCGHDPVPPAPADQESSAGKPPEPPNGSLASATH